MIELVKPVFDQYKTTTGLLTVTLDGISDEISRKRLNDNTNPIVFIAGHIVYGRFVSANLLGLNAGYPFDGICNRGQALKDVSIYPAVEESVKTWHEITVRVFDKMESITEKEILTEPTNHFPTDDKTIRGALIFMGAHDMYHIGQLIMLRKSFGLKSVIG